jgi:hypothetical protein
MDGPPMAYLIFALLLLIAYINRIRPRRIESYATSSEPGTSRRSRLQEHSAYVQVLIRFFEILDSLASSISLPEDVTVLD